MTGQHSGEGTTSLLLATNDPLGVKFVVTAPAAADSSVVPSAKRIKTNEKDATSIAHFALANLTRFAEAHRGNGQGVGTLGFALPPGGIEKVHANYLAKHPALLVGGASSPEAAIATYEEGGVQTKVRAFLLTFSVVLRLRPDYSFKRITLATSSQLESTLMPCSTCPLMIFFSFLFPIYRNAFSLQ